MRFHFTYYLNHLNTDDHYVALGQSVLLGRLNSGRTDSGGRLAGVPIVGPCSLEGRRVDICVSSVAETALGSPSIGCEASASLCDTSPVPILVACDASPISITVACDASPIPITCRGDCCDIACAGTFMSPGGGGRPGAGVLAGAGAGAGAGVGAGAGAGAVGSVL